MKGLSPCLVVLGLLACAVPEERNHHLLIATGPAGETPGSFDEVLSTALGQFLQPEISVSGLASAGSGENIQMLLNREAQLAVVQSLCGDWAYEGKGPYEGRPIRDLRSIGTLFESVQHFLLRSPHARTGLITDLKNLKHSFSVGGPGSGTDESTHFLLEALGIFPGRDFTPEYLGIDPSARTLLAERIAGFSLSAKTPAAPVARVFEHLGGHRIALLAFSDEHLSVARRAFPFWSRFTIAPDTYPGQNHAVHTLSQMQFLACREDLPKEVVYAVTQALYEHLPQSRNLHPAFQDMALEKALSGLTVPLHPGALKYYREKGLEIPPELVGE